MSREESFSRCAESEKRTSKANKETEQQYSVSRVSSPGHEAHLQGEPADAIWNPWPCLGAVSLSLNQKTELTSWLHLISQEHLGKRKVFEYLQIFCFLQSGNKSQIPSKWHSVSLKTATTLGAHVGKKDGCFAGI